MARSERARAADGKKNLVGLRVRARRTEIGLTQDALNVRLALITNGAWNPAQQEILHVERGSRIVSDIEVVALAKALGCLTSWLLLVEGEEEGGENAQSGALLHDRLSWCCADK